MHQDDICLKLHKIESYISSVDQERDRMRQENDFLRNKLQASIRQNRINKKSFNFWFSKKI